MLNAVKYVVRRVLAGFGYDVIPYGCWYPNWRPELLSQLASPATVIDVGVGEGTPRLYEAFPNARYLLVEPLHEFLPCLEGILEKHEGTYYLGAAGEKEATATICVEQDPTQGKEKSSFHRRLGFSKAGNRLEEREVPVTPLDRLVEELGLQAPFVIKVDTEGHELSVLKGAKQTLLQTDLIIAETCVAKRFDESYSFTEYVNFMGNMGFTFYGIVGASVVPKTQQIVYLDSLFIPIARKT